MEQFAANQLHIRSLGYPRKDPPSYSYLPILPIYLFYPIYPKLMLLGHSPSEVFESFSVSDCPETYQLAYSLHDNRVFVRIGALANVILDFQRPVVAQKQGRKL